MVRNLLTLLSVLLTAVFAAPRAQQSPVRLIETPAGAGSAMYALSPAAPPPRGTRAAGPILSWIEPLAAGGHVLRFATLDGDRWSEPRDVARGTNWFANWADHPSVVRLGDDAGTLLAHWLVRSGDGTSRYGYGLRIARSTDGGRQWMPLLTVEPDDVADYAGFVAFSTEGTTPGAAYLAPSPEPLTRADHQPESDNRAHHPAPAGSAPDAGHAESRKALLYTHFLSDGRVATDVIDPDTCSCCTVATGWAAGTQIVAYRDHAPGEVRDIAVVRRQGSGWTDPTPVHQDGWVIPGCPTNGPALAADGNRVAVAWFTAAGGVPHVRVAFSPDGGVSFGAPIDVDGGAPIGWAGVVLTDEGDAIVSWLEGRPGGGAQVRVRRVAERGGPGAPLVVAETKGGRATGIPQLSRSGSRLLLAWRDERVRTAVVPITAVGLRVAQPER